ncbi:MAG: xanthine dehydrogenase family protein subunit M [Chloroflexi bacterium]|nr:MAG: xanthine dehydrogenase family protein subunit M [Chloroflexota bacterium]
MKPAPFEYQAPDTLDAALDILAEHGDEAKVLAGGQSLIPAMNFRLLQPTMLVDINAVSTLEYIEADEDGSVRIGGLTRQAAMGKSETVKKHAPLLHEVVPNIAHPQIRNRGTLGGSLVHADPASELPVVALALDAEIKVQSKDAERVVAAQDFFLGTFYTDIMPNEIVTEVKLAAMPDNSGYSFMEVARRKGDYAMMGVAALLTLDESGTCTHAKLVYLNAGDGTIVAQESAQMLVGETPSDDIFTAAAEKASKEEIDPMGNVHTSVDYQRHLARVLTQRSLNQALQRAQNGKDAN